MKYWKKWWFWIILFVFILTVILLLTYRPKSGCPNEYVIVNCNPGYYCVSEDEAKIIDCATIATTSSEKDLWLCTGRGFSPMNCQRK
jgi:hypothetical protein